MGRPRPGQIRVLRDLARGQAQPDPLASGAFFLERLADAKKVATDVPCSGMVGAECTLMDREGTL